MVWIAAVLHKKAFEYTTPFAYIINSKAYERATVGKERIDKRCIAINVGPTTGIWILLDKKSSLTDALGIIWTSRTKHKKCTARRKKLLEIFALQNQALSSLMLFMSNADLEPSLASFIPPVILVPLP